MAYFARLARLYGSSYHIYNIILIFFLSVLSSNRFSDDSIVQCGFILNSIKPRSAYWHFIFIYCAVVFLEISLNNSRRIIKNPSVI